MATDTQLRAWYVEWVEGTPKSHIEKQYLGDDSSNGQHISRLWREQLGIETVKVHPAILVVGILAEFAREQGADFEGWLDAGELTQAQYDLIQRAMT